MPYNYLLDARVRAATLGEARSLMQASGIDVIGVTDHTIAAMEARGLRVVPVFAAGLDALSVSDAVAVTRATRCGR